MDYIRKIIIKTTEGIDNPPYGVFKEITIKNDEIVKSKIINPSKLYGKFKLQ